MYGGWPAMWCIMRGAWFIGGIPYGRESERPASQQDPGRGAAWAQSWHSHQSPPRAAEAWQSQKPNSRPSPAPESSPGQTMLTAPRPSRRLPTGHCPGAASVRGAAHVTHGDGSLHGACHRSGGPRHLFLDHGRLRAFRLPLLPLAVALHVGAFHFRDDVGVRLGVLDPLGAERARQGEPGRPGSSHGTRQTAAPGPGRHLPSACRRRGTPAWTSRRWWRC